MGVTRLFLIFPLMIAVLVTNISTSRAQFGDFFKDFKRIIGIDQELTDDKIIQGLKEALRIGSQNAVGTVSIMDGYFNNSKIKIPLPSSLQKIERIIRVSGYGAMVDSFELSMNRAAEQAAPQAKSLFWEAIEQMTIDDAQKIMNGRVNEATVYFKENSYNRLGEIFKPIVHDSMTGVGVTRQYQYLEAKIHSLPLIKFSSFDLDQYVTDKALDGLFLMVEEEERKIRENPSARVTTLLKEVFGKR